MIDHMVQVALTGNRDGETYLRNFGWQWGFAVVLMMVCSAGPISDDLPSHYFIAPALENEMVGAYLDCIRLQESAKAAAAQFPDLAKEIQSAQSEFEKRFGPSLDMIDRLLSRKPAWLERKAIWIDQIKKQTDSTQCSRESVNAAIRLTNQTTSGRTDTNVLKLLLTFDPSYVKSPVEQFNDGYVVMFNSKDNMLALGVDFDVQLPMSWLWKPAQDASILVNAVSANGNGGDSIMVAVRTIEHGISKDPAAMAKLFEKTGFQSMSQITLSGRPALQIEGEHSVEKDGLQYRMRSRMYAVAFEDRLLSVQCFVYVKGPDNALLNARFASFEPLFDKVGHSLVIHGSETPASKPDQATEN